MPSPMPEFRNISDGFMVTLFGKEYKDVGKDVGKEMTESLAKVYNLVKQRPTITILEIAKITSYAPRTVERSL